jgi:uncharacterized protein
MITLTKLAMIEEAEGFLHTIGFLPCRVRMHGSIARIEILKDDVTKLLAMLDLLVRTFKAIGFTYVALDLEGYRTGSMDEVLARGDQKP